MNKTTTRNEMSKSNKYYIPKERYMELKHFCRQYQMWCNAYVHLDGLSKLPEEEINRLNPTMDIAIVRERYKRWIDMVDEAAKQSDPLLVTYIRKAVTEGRTFEYLDLNCGGVPCARNTFYDRCRKFFYILSGLRE